VSGVFCSGAHRTLCFGVLPRQSRLPSLIWERFNVSIFCRFSVHILISLLISDRVCVGIAAEMNLELLGEFCCLRVC